MQIKSNLLIPALLSKLGVFMLQPATTAEHKLCSPNLTKVGLMVARRIGEQAVNATHDTNKTGMA